jgi:protein SCO1/2
MTLALLALLACAPAVVDEPAAPVAAYDMSAPLPADSVYQLEAPLVGADAGALGLDIHRGHPTLISMFYASCPMACPMLVADIQSLEAKLTKEERADLRVLLVSLDPDRDTPEALTEAQERYNLDTTRWTLTRTEEFHVREIAAVLGIQYRSLADGEMNHSSIITVLDRDGRIDAKLEGLQKDPEPLIAALRKSK